MRRVFRDLVELGVLLAALGVGDVVDMVPGGVDGLRGALGGEDSGRWVGAALDQIPQLAVVPAILRQGQGEDGRIRGHADNVAVSDQERKFPAARSSRDRSSSHTATPRADSSASGSCSVRLVMQTLGLSGGSQADSEWLLSDPGGRQSRSGTASLRPDTGHSPPPATY